MVDLEEEEGIIFLPKDLQHNQNQGVELIKCEDDDDDDDDADDNDGFGDDNDDDDMFSSSQQTPNTIGNRGEQ